jgi:hypothetical protein
MFESQSLGSLVILGAVAVAISTVCGFIIEQTMREASFGVGGNAILILFGLVLMSFLVPDRQEELLVTDVMAACVLCAATATGLLLLFAKFRLSMKQRGRA